MWGVVVFFLNKYILLSVRYVIDINNFTYKGFFKKKYITGVIKKTHHKIHY